MVVIVHGQFAVSPAATPLTVCAIWPVTFMNGFRIGITKVTMEPQLMVPLGNHLQALAGLFAAAPGATAPGTCGQLFAAATCPAIASTTSGFASQSRCARPLALGPLDPWPCAPVGQATAQRRHHWPTGVPGVARQQSGAS